MSLKRGGVLRLTSRDWKMPQLKRLVDSAPAVATAEQLFARPLHDMADMQTRREAAAKCAAPEFTMARLLQGQTESNDWRSWTQVPHTSLEECVRSAIGAPGHAHFVVCHAKLMAKRVRFTLERLGVDGDSRDNALRRFIFTETREIHMVLSALHGIHIMEARPSKVFIGPLCDYFTPFLTTNGLTKTGDGLLRMLLLACKRLRAHHSDTEVTIIQPALN